MSRRGFALAYGLALVVACGGRTRMYEPPAIPPSAECTVDADCPGHDDACAPVRCLDSERNADLLPDVPEGKLLPPRVCFIPEVLSCDDGDACTDDRCDPVTGCFFNPVTPDLDGDGRRAPLPGKKAGDPGACGDDCNDASADAFPGQVESCDGVDNDCNGVVDEGADFLPTASEPLRLSGDVEPAGPGGLAASATEYLAAYWGAKSGGDTFVTRLDSTGTPIPPTEQKVALQNADSSGGPVVWVGDRYGVAWQDRRAGDYEIYFTELSAAGKKVLPDLRVTDAFDFSINPDLAWNGSEFVIAWQDRRNGVFEIFAQRIKLTGELAGMAVNVSSGAEFPQVDAEAPSIAAGQKTLGVVYAVGAVGAQSIVWKALAADTLEEVAGPLVVSLPGAEAVAPQIAWSEDRFVVTWYHRTASPGLSRAIYATALDEAGNVLVPPTAVSEPPPGRRSRYPQLLPLGDRLFFVYADDRDGNQGYEIYSRMLGADLVPLGPERRVTNAPFDSIYPVPAFGPGGDIGVLFRDDRTNGAQHVYFTRLGCVATP